MKTNITKNQIEVLYIVQRKRRHEIAEELGIEPYQVQYLAAKFGLTRPRLERTRPKSCYSFDESFFKKIDTEEKAYWLGFIAADGCIVDAKSKRCLRIELSSKDRGHLEKLKSAIKYDGPIHYDRKHHLTYNGKTDIFLCDMLQINHRELVKDFINLGVTPRKSKTLQPPVIRKSLIRHWIRGYFDGDGSVSIVESTNNICGSIFGNKQVMEFISDHFRKELDTEALSHYRKKKNGWEMCFHGNQLAKKVERYFYRNATVFLDRKYHKFHALD